MERKKLTNCLSEADGVRKKWGWFCFLGFLLVALGLLMIGSAYQTTVFSVFLFGVLLFGAGILQIIQGFFAAKWSGFFPSVILAVLCMVLGLLCAQNPERAAMNLTLLFAAFCFVSGIVKMIVSLFVQFERWGVVFFNGIVTFILGALIYSEWPLSGLWVIGAFIGIDVLLTGCSWIALSFVAKDA